MNRDNYSIKEMIEEFRRDTKEALFRIEQTAKDTSTKVGIQNGRVTKLEILSNDLVKVSENNTTSINVLKRTKIQIWTAIAVGTIFVGTIIILAIMAIDNKIKDGIQQALVDYEVK